MIWYLYLYISINLEYKNNLTKQTTNILYKTNMNKKY